MITGQQEAGVNLSTLRTILRIVTLVTYSCTITICLIRSLCIKNTWFDALGLIIGIITTETANYLDILGNIV